MVSHEQKEVILLEKSERTVIENSIEGFFEHIGSEGGSPRTQKRYEHDVKMFLDFLGARKITPKILEDYKAEMQGKYSGATVKTMIFGVNKYLAFIGCEYRADDKGVIARRAEACGERLTTEEYLRVLNAVKDCRDDRLYVVVKTICCTGLKYGELQYLNVESIETGRLTLPCGVRKDRNVYLPKSLCGDLRRYCQNNGIYRGSIFLTKYGNFPDRGNMSEAIRAACRNTGIDPKKISMKSFKEFYAANLENMRGEISELIDEELRISRAVDFSGNGGVISQGFTG